MTTLTMRPISSDVGHIKYAMSYLLRVRASSIPTQRHDPESHWIKALDPATHWIKMLTQRQYPVSHWIKMLTQRLDSVSY